MSREHILRPAVWTAAFVNLAALPASSMGRFAGLLALVFAWCLLDLRR
jgi:hypothetical protein